KTGNVRLNSHKTEAIFTELGELGIVPKGGSFALEVRDTKEGLKFYINNTPLTREQTDTVLKLITMHGLKPKNIDIAVRSGLALLTSDGKVVKVMHLKAPTDTAIPESVRTHTKTKAKANPDNVIDFNKYKEAKKKKTEKKKKDKSGKPPSAPTATGTDKPAPHKVPERKMPAAAKEALAAAKKCAKSTLDTFKKGLGNIIPQPQAAAEGPAGVSPQGMRVPVVPPIMQNNASHPGGINPRHTQTTGLGEIDTKYMPSYIATEPVTAKSVLNKTPTINNLNELKAEVDKTYSRYKLLVSHAGEDYFNVDSFKGYLQGCNALDRLITDILWQAEKIPGSEKLIDRLVTIRANMIILCYTPLLRKADNLSMLDMLDFKNAFKRNTASTTQEEVYLALNDPEKLEIDLFMPRLERASNLLDQFKNLNDLSFEELKEYIEACEVAWNTADKLLNLKNLKPADIELLKAEADKAVENYKEALKITLEHDGLNLGEKFLILAEFIKNTHEEVWNLKELQNAAIQILDALVKKRQDESRSIESYTRLKIRVKDIFNSDTNEAISVAIINTLRNYLTKKLTEKSDRRTYLQIGPFLQEFSETEKRGNNIPKSPSKDNIPKPPSAGNASKNTNLWKATNEFAKKVADGLKNLLGTEAVTPEGIKMPAGIPEKPVSMRMDGRALGANPVVAVFRKDLLHVYSLSSRENFGYSDALEYVTGCSRIYKELSTAIDNAGTDTSTRSTLADLKKELVNTIYPDLINCFEKLPNHDQSPFLLEIINNCPDEIFKKHLNLLITKTSTLGAVERENFDIKNAIKYLRVCNTIYKKASAFIEAEQDSPSRTSLKLALADLDKVYTDVINCIVKLGKNQQARFLLKFLSDCPDEIFKKQLNTLTFLARITITDRISSLNFYKEKTVLSEADFQLYLEECNRRFDELTRLIEIFEGKSEDKNYLLDRIRLIYNAIDAEFVLKNEQEKIVKEYYTDLLKKADALADSQQKTKLINLIHNSLPSNVKKHYEITTHISLTRTGSLTPEQTDILNIIRHDMRSPLASLDAALHLLISGYPKYESVLGYIRSEFDKISENFANIFSPYNPEFKDSNFEEVLDKKFEELTKHVTALESVVNAINFSQWGKLSEKEIDLINTVKRTLQDTKDTFEKRTDYLNLTTEYIQSNISKVNLKSLVEKIWEEFCWEKPNGKPVNLKTNIYETLQIPGNQLSFIVVLRNIFQDIMDEFKQNKSGYYEIIVGAHKDGTSGKFILTVEDNGPGIPENRRESVFEGDSSKGEGRGFGLKRVKRLVHDNGGRIWAAERTSEDGESVPGNKFIMVFDKGKAPDRTPDPGRRNLNGINGQDPGIVRDPLFDGARTPVPADTLNETKAPAAIDKEAGTEALHFIRHDFNSPINSIRAFLDMAQLINSGLRDNPDFKTALEKVDYLEKEFDNYFPHPGSINNFSSFLDSLEGKFRKLSSSINEIDRLLNTFEIYRSLTPEKIKILLNDYYHPEKGRKFTPEEELEAAFAAVKSNINSAKRNFEAELTDIIDLTPANIMKNSKQFNLTELVQNTVNRTGGRRIKFETQNNYPVVANEEKIGFVVAELINNALRIFNQEGKGDRVEILIETGKEANTIQIFVSDNGPGVPDNMKRRIFDEGETTTQKSGGTGGGLYVANKIIAAHKGTIEATDTPGGGTTFVIELPCGGEIPQPEMSLTESWIDKATRYCENGHITEGIKDAFVMLLQEYYGKQDLSHAQLKAYLHFCDIINENLSKLDSITRAEFKTFLSGEETGHINPYLDIIHNITNPNPRFEVRQRVNFLIEFIETCPEEIFEAHHAKLAYLVNNLVTNAVKGGLDYFKDNTSDLQGLLYYFSECQEKFHEVSRLITLSEKRHQIDPGNRLPELRKDLVDIYYKDTLDKAESLPEKDRREFLEQAMGRLPDMAKENKDIAKRLTGHRDVITATSPEGRILAEIRHNYRAPLNSLKGRLRHIIESTQSADLQEKLEPLLNAADNLYNDFDHTFRAGNPLFTTSGFKDTLDRQCGRMLGLLNTIEIGLKEINFSVIPAENKDLRSNVDELLKTPASIRREFDKRNKLLDLNPGFVERNRVKVGLSTIVEKAATDFTHIYINNKRVKLIIDIPEGLNVYAHPFSLVSVFRNLLENSKNALETVKQDEYVISIKAREDANTGNIMVSSSDNGPGVHAKRKKAIFTGDSTTKGGTGFGLPKIMELVTANGGTIKENGKFGKGAEFNIELLSKSPTEAFESKRVSVTKALKELAVITHDYKPRVNALLMAVRNINTDYPELLAKNPELNNIFTELLETAEKLNQAVNRLHEKYSKKFKAACDYDSRTVSLAELTAFKTELNAFKKDARKIKELNAEFNRVLSFEIIEQEPTGRLQTDLILMQEAVKEFTETNLFNLTPEYISSNKTRINLQKFFEALMFRTAKGRKISRQTKDGIITLQAELDPVRGNRPSTLTVSLPQNSFLYGNNHSLLVIFDNLIANSQNMISLADRAAYNINIAITPDRKTNKTIFNYSDNGLGIEADKKQKVFNGYSSREDGTGSGLQKVAEQTEAHGGKIYENGDYGEGAKFVLTIPTMPPEAYPFGKAKAENTKAKPGRAPFEKTELQKGTVGSDLTQARAKANKPREYRSHTGMPVKSADGTITTPHSSKNIHILRKLKEKVILAILNKKSAVEQTLKEHKIKVKANEFYDAETKEYRLYHLVDHIINSGYNGPENAMLFCVKLIGLYRKKQGELFTRSEIALLEAGAVRAAVHDVLQEKQPNLHDTYGSNSILAKYILELKEDFLMDFFWNNQKFGVNKDELLDAIYYRLRWFSRQTAEDFKLAFENKRPELTLEQKKAQLLVCNGFFTEVTKVGSNATDDQKLKGNLRFVKSTLLHNYYDFILLDFEGIRDSDKSRALVEYFHNNIPAEVKRHYEIQTDHPNYEKLQEIRHGLRSHIASLKMNLTSLARRTKDSPEIKEKALSIVDKADALEAYETGFSDDNYTGENLNEPQFSNLIKAQLRLLTTHTLEINALMLEAMPEKIFNLPAQIIEKILEYADEKTAERIKSRLPENITEYLNTEKDMPFKAVKSTFILFKETVLDNNTNVGFSILGNKDCRKVLSPQDFSFIIENIIQNSISAFNRQIAEDPERYKDKQYEVTVQFAGAKEGEDGPVNITLSDNGPGIPPALPSADGNIPKVNKETIWYAGVTEGGKGYGLSLVKEKVEKAGGRIYENGKYGEGVQFCIELPGKESKPAEVKPEVKITEKAPGDGLIKGTEINLQQSGRSKVPGSPAETKIGLTETPISSSEFGGKAPGAAGMSTRKPGMHNGVNIGIPISKLNVFHGILRKITKGLEKPTVRVDNFEIFFYTLAKENAEVAVEILERLLEINNEQGWNLNNLIDIYNQIARLASVRFPEGREALKSLFNCGNIERIKENIAKVSREEEYNPILKKDKILTAKNGRTPDMEVEQSPFVNSILSSPILSGLDKDTMGQLDVFARRTSNLAKHLATKHNHPDPKLLTFNIEKGLNINKKFKKVLNIEELDALEKTATVFNRKFYKAKTSMILTKLELDSMPVKDAHNMIVTFLVAAFNYTFSSHYKVENFIAELRELQEIYLENTKQFQKTLTPEENKINSIILGVTRQDQRLAIIKEIKKLPSKLINDLIDNNCIIVFAEDDTLSEPVLNMYLDRESGHPESKKLVILGRDSRMDLTSAIFRETSYRILHSKGLGFLKEEIENIQTVAEKEFGLKGEDFEEFFASSFGAFLTNTYKTYFYTEVLLKDLFKCPLIKGRGIKKDSANKPLEEIIRLLTEIYEKSGGKDIPYGEQLNIKEVHTVKQEPAKDHGKRWMGGKPDKEITPNPEFERPGLMPETPPDAEISEYNKKLLLALWETEGNRVEAAKTLNAAPKTIGTHANNFIESATARQLEACALQLSKESGKHITATQLLKYCGYQKFNRLLTTLGKNHESINPEFIQTTLGIQGLSPSKCRLYILKLKDTGADFEKEFNLSEQQINSILVILSKCTKVDRGTFYIPKTTEIENEAKTEGTSKAETAKKIKEIKDTEYHNTLQEIGKNYENLYAALRSTLSQRPETIIGLRNYIRELKQKGIDFKAQYNLTAKEVEAILLILKSAHLSKLKAQYMAGKQKFAPNQPGLTFPQEALPAERATGPLAEKVQEPKLESAIDTIITMAKQPPAETKTAKPSGAAGGEKYTIEQKAAAMIQIHRQTGRYSSTEAAKILKKESKEIINESIIRQPLNKFIEEASFEKLQECAIKVSEILGETVTDGELLLACTTKHFRAALTDLGNHLAKFDNRIEASDIQDILKKHNIREEAFNEYLIKLSKSNANLSKTHKLSHEQIDNLAKLLTPDTDTVLRLLIEDPYKLQPEFTAVLRGVCGDRAVTGAIIKLRNLIKTHREVVEKLLADPLGVDKTQKLLNTLDPKQIGITKAPAEASPEQVVTSTVSTGDIIHDNLSITERDIETLYHHWMNPHITQVPNLTNVKNRCSQLAKNKQRELIYRLNALAKKRGKNKKIDMPALTWLLSLNRNITLKEKAPPIEGSTWRSYPKSAQPASVPSPKPEPVSAPEQIEKAASAKESIIEEKYTIEQKISAMIKAHRQTKIYSPVRAAQILEEEHGTQIKSNSVGQHLNKFIEKPTTTIEILNALAKKLGVKTEEVILACCKQQFRVSLIELGKELADKNIGLPEIRSILNSHSIRKLPDEVFYRYISKLRDCEADLSKDYNLNREQITYLAGLFEKGNTPDKLTTGGTSAPLQASKAKANKTRKRGVFPEPTRPEKLSHEKAEFSQWDDGLTAKEHLVIYLLENNKNTFLKNPKKYVADLIHTYCQKKIKAIDKLIQLIKNKELVIQGFKTRDINILLTALGQVRDDISKKSGTATVKQDTEPQKITEPTQAVP
ncbi:MAG: ATP-binding protein, partial [Armatimonadota bacterium]